MKRKKTISETCRDAEKAVKRKFGYLDYVKDNLAPVYTGFWKTADMAGDAAVYHDFHIRMARVQSTAAHLANLAGLEHEVHMHDQLSGIHEEMAILSAQRYYEDRRQMASRPEDQVSQKTMTNIKWPPEDLAQSYVEVQEKPERNPK